YPGAIMDYDTITQEHERLIEEGHQTFRIASLDDLPPFGRAVITTYLTHNLYIPWQLGNINIGSSYIIKVLDKGIAYLLILPNGSYHNQTTDEFVFYWKDHKTQMSPDQASMYLIKKANPDLKIRTIKNDDGDTIHEFTGPQGTI